MDLESKKALGYAKIWKWVTKSDVWTKNPTYVKFWFWILIEAHHPDRKEYDGKITVLKGQVLASKRQIMDALKWKKGRGFVTVTDTAIDMLLRTFKDMGLVTIKDTDFGKLISVIKFDDWNGGEIETDCETDDELDYQTYDETDGETDRETNQHTLSSYALSSNSLNPLTSTQSIPLSSEQNTTARYEEKEQSPKEQKPTNTHPFPHADDLPDESEHAQLGIEATGHINAITGRTGIPALSIRKKMGALISQVGWERFKEIVTENEKRLQSARVPGSMICAMIEANPEKQPTPFHCPECHHPEFNTSKRNHGDSSPGVPDHWKHKPIYECQKCKHRTEIPENEMPEKSKRERKRNWRTPPQRCNAPRPFETVGDVIPSVMAGGA